MCNDSMPPAIVVDSCALDFVQISYSDQSEPCDDGIRITRTWTAVDTCQNQTSFTQFIFLGDETGPAMEPLHPMLIEAGNGGTISISCEEGFPDFIEADVLANDDCTPKSDVQLSVDGYTPETCEDGFVDQNVYTWTGTDVCGNQSVFEVTVNLVDTTAPVIANLPEDLLTVCGPVAPLAGVIAIDNCTQPAVMEVSNVIFEQDDEGMIMVERTWIAYDDCGNATAQTRMIRFVQESDLSCEILPLDIPECSSFGNEITVVVKGGGGPYKYNWKASGNCFIEGGQGTQNHHLLHWFRSCHFYGRSHGCLWMYNHLHLYDRM